MTLNRGISPQENWQWGTIGCYLSVICGAGLVTVRKALFMLFQRLALVIRRLKQFAIEHPDVSRLSVTQRQPAQPTTVLPSSPVV